VTPTERARAAPHPGASRSAGVPAGSAPSPVLPGTRYARALSRGERLVLDAARAWVLAFRGRRSPLAAVQARLGPAGLAEGGEGLSDLLYTTAAAATRPVDVRCVRCSMLSPDEMRLLAAVERMQSGRPYFAHRHLGDWLAGAARRAAVAAAARLAHACAAAGLTLPARDWPLPGPRRCVTGSTDPDVPG